jgi:hypothetical protein
MLGIFVQCFLGQGFHFIRSGKLLKLSEQEVVDCAGGDNMGCNGANFDALFQYIVANGSCLETAYPYQSSSGQFYPCRDKVGGFAVSALLLPAVVPASELLTTALSGWCDSAAIAALGC